MAYVSLAIFKKQVHAEDFTEDDEYLQTLLDAAESHIIRSTNRTEAELKAMSSEANTLPRELRMATLMLGGHWYNQREAVSGTQYHDVPRTLDALVKPFRKLVSTGEGSESSESSESSENSENSENQESQEQG